MGRPHRPGGGVTALLDIKMNERRKDEGIVLTEEQKRRRRARSLAIALSLGALVLLFYIVTVVKLGPGILSRPL